MVHSMDFSIIVKRWPIRLKLHQEEDLGEEMPKTASKTPNEAGKGGKNAF